MLCSNSLSGVRGRTKPVRVDMQVCVGLLRGCCASRTKLLNEAPYRRATLRIMGCVCFWVCWCAGRGGGLPPPFLVSVNHKYRNGDWLGPFARAAFAERMQQVARRWRAALANRQRRRLQTQRAPDQL